MRERSTLATTSAYRPIEWRGDANGYLLLLDQTQLPEDMRFLECRDVEEVFEAIRRLSVRGAPAIGVAAAYGSVIGAQSARTANLSEFLQAFHRVLDRLAESRPTAVNLFWALDRMRRFAAAAETTSAAVLHDLLLEEAIRIEQEDREMCAAIGRHGKGLLASCTGVLTHCNTGGLATAGDGTAFAVIVAAARENPQLHVYADETRPLLQGARLTMWELMQREIGCTLICDSMAAWVMKHKKVQAVIVGADRIAANGDSANKIGTYGLSVLARHHQIPFYVAAPSSTFDLSIADGSVIPIEERNSSEITNAFGRQTAPANCKTFNPAFDVAPAENIAGLITEKGVVAPVTRENIQKLLGTGLAAT